MSNPGLLISVAGAVGLKEISETWAINLDDVRWESPDVYAYVNQSIGLISAWLRRDPRELLDLKSFYVKPAWHSFLKLTCPSSWNDVRYALLFLLAERIVFEDECLNRDDSVLLAWLDTGAILLLVKDRKIIVNERFKNQLLHLKPNIEFQDLTFPD